MENQIATLREEIQILKQKLNNYNFKLLDDKVIESMTLEEINEFEEKMKNVKKLINDRKVEFDLL